MDTPAAIASESGQHHRGGDDQAPDLASPWGLAYDGWVADRWSLGGMLRFTYAKLHYDNNGVEEDWTVASPGLVFIATFH
ncbi:MAG: hypothetical protein R3B13_11855 [Polyangiaceae bacterium]